MRLAHILSEKRAADRAEMSYLLAVAVVAAGGSIASDRDWHEWHRRAVMLRIASPSGPTISVDLDGESRQIDTHVATWDLPFEMSKAGLRFADDGSGWGRPHHKRTVVARGFVPLVEKIVDDLQSFTAGHGLTYTVEVKR